MSVYAALNICRINSAFSAKRARCSELILFFASGTVTTSAENLCGSKAARKSKCAEDERTFYKLPHTSSIWKFELFAPVLGGPVELKFQLSALSFFGIAKPAGRSARDEER